MCIGKNSINRIWYCLQFQEFTEGLEIYSLWMRNYCIKSSGRSLFFRCFCSVMSGGLLSIKTNTNISFYTTNISFHATNISLLLIQCDSI